MKTVDELMTLADKMRQASVTNFQASEEWRDVLLSALQEVVQPVAPPLTLEQIDASWRSVDYTQPYDDFRIAIARAIELAHGIGARSAGGA